MQEAWERLQLWQAGLNEPQKLPAVLTVMSDNILQTPHLEPPPIFPVWVRVCFFLLLPFGLIFGSLYVYRALRRDFARGHGYDLIE